MKLRDIMGKRDAMYKLSDQIELDISFFPTSVLIKSGGEKLLETKKTTVLVLAESKAVDEILSVGDAAFQQKCEQRISEILNRGTTLVFVSHSSEQVKRLCKKAIWLNNGIIQKMGDSAEVCSSYEEFLRVSNQPCNA